MSAGSRSSRSPPLPEVVDGDRLGDLIVAAAAGIAELADGEIVVVSQKVVSKAEGRVRDLAAVEPGRRALELAAEVDRDPRLVELVLAESRRIVRATPSALIVETHGGLDLRQRRHRRLQPARRRLGRPAARRRRRLRAADPRRDRVRRPAARPGGA